MVATAAPGSDGQTPELVFDSYIEVPGVISRNKTYPIEVWNTAAGHVAIVTDVPTNTSLMNANEKIAAEIWAQWPGARIVENWPQKTVDGLQFYDTSGTGGHRPADLDSLTALGLTLPA